MVRKFNGKEVDWHTPIHSVGSHSWSLASKSMTLLKYICQVQWRAHWRKRVKRLLWESRLIQVQETCKARFIVFHMYKNWG